MAASPPVLRLELCRSRRDNFGSPSALEMAVFANALSLSCEGEKMQFCANMI